MVIAIVYVDTSTGVGGDALFWEFAKTEDEAQIKARAHLPLVRARFGAVGYRILDRAGSPIAAGPGVHDFPSPTLHREHFLPM
jgi:hypothetical protein